MRAGRWLLVGFLGAVLAGCLSEAQPGDEAPPDQTQARQAWLHGLRVEATGPVSLAVFHVPAQVILPAGALVENMVIYDNHRFYLRVTLPSGVTVAVGHNWQHTPGMTCNAGKDGPLVGTAQAEREVAAICASFRAE